MRLSLSLIFALCLLFAAIGIVVAQTDQSTTGTPDSTVGTSTTSDLKGDECTIAKVRTQLMDNGIHTKSATSTTGTSGTRTPVDEDFITVNVDNGVVTLSGTVDSSSQQDRIVTIVKGISEVKRVVPNLQVRGKTGDLNSTGTDTPSQISDNTPAINPEETSTDAELTSAVRGKFTTDGKMMPGVQVETENGVVTLTGTVDSQGEAERLILLARSVPNVKSVTSNLRIRNSQ
jgi:hyperosmotically inducible protein